MFLTKEKTKRIAKFGGSEPRRCENMKGSVAPEIGRKVSGLLRNRGPVRNLKALRRGTTLWQHVLRYQASSSLIPDLQSRRTFNNKQHKQTRLFIAFVY